LEEIPVVQYAPEVIICVSAGAKVVQLKACGKAWKVDGDLKIVIDSSPNYY